MREDRTIPSILVFRNGAEVRTMLSEVPSVGDGLKWDGEGVTPGDFIVVTRRDWLVDELGVKKVYVYVEGPTSGESE